MIIKKSFSAFINIKVYINNNKILIHFFKEKGLMIIDVMNNFVNVYKLYECISSESLQNL
jgi:hypothetical protein